MRIENLISVQILRATFSFRELEVIPQEALCQNDLHDVGCEEASGTGIPSVPKMHMRFVRRRKQYCILVLRVLTQLVVS